MSEKGPFNAAVVILKRKLDLQEYDDFETNLLWHIELGKAIRLLEVAGAMLPEDIIWLRHQVDRITEYAPIPDAGYVCPGRSRKNRFRALLEALPKKREEICKRK